MGFLPEGHLVETDRSGLVGGYLGQTALKTAEIIKKALGGVLFVDEAYALAREGKGYEGDSYGTEAIDTLLKAMEDNRDQLIVIVAGYREPMQKFLESNPGLRSRFTRYIDFPDYSAGELMDIFERMVVKDGYQLSDAARNGAAAIFADAYAKRTTTFGRNGRLARTVFEKACIRLADRLATDVNITRDELTTFQAGGHRGQHMKARRHRNARLFRQIRRISQKGNGPLGLRTNYCQSFADGPKKLRIAEIFLLRGRVCLFSQFAIVISLHPID